MSRRILEITTAGIILLLILFSGLQAWFMLCVNNPLLNHPLADFGHLIDSLDTMLHEAMILGIPLVIGIGCAATGLQLRCIIPLLMLYALIVLQFITPLRSVLMGLSVSHPELTYWERATTSIKVFFQNFPMENMSVLLYLEAALTTVAACLFGWWVARQNGRPLDLRTNKRKRLIVAAVYILLVLSTIFSLFGTITRPLLNWAGSMATPDDAGFALNMRYLLLGGSTASWLRPGSGDRGPILLFSWVLFVVACLYGARWLTTRQALILTGIFTLSITLAQIIIPLSSEAKNAYYSGLQMALAINSRPDAGFWLYNIPYPAAYLLQLLFCAGGLLGSAAIFRALARRPSQ